MLGKKDCDFEAVRKLLYKQHRLDENDVSLAHNKAVFYAVLERDLGESDALFGRVEDMESYDVPQLEPGWQINYIGADIYTN